MAAVIQKPKQYNLRDIYKHYSKKLLENNPTWYGKYDKNLKLLNCYIYAVDKDGKVVMKMSWPLWKSIVLLFYKAAKDAVIRGEVLNLGSNLGKIRGVRIERDFSKPKINWRLTFMNNEKDENGKYLKIYHTEEDYCRIAWEKSRKLPNMSCYNFAPPHKCPTTQMGFKKEFSTALVANPLLKFKYKFIPLLRPNLIKKQLEKEKECSTLIPV